MSAAKYGSLNVPSDEGAGVPFAAATLKSNFRIFSIFFSLNLACVTTAVSFAAADFAALGNYSNGLLYAGYMLSALFVASCAVELRDERPCEVREVWLHACQFKDRWHHIEQLHRLTHNMSL